MYYDNNIIFFVVAEGNLMVLLVIVDCCIVSVWWRGWLLHCSLLDHWLSYFISTISSVALHKVIPQLFCLMGLPQLNIHHLVHGGPTFVAATNTVKVTKRLHWLLALLLHHKRLSDFAFTAAILITRSINIICTPCQSNNNFFICHHYVEQQQWAAAAASAPPKKRSTTQAHLTSEE